MNLKEFDAHCLNLQKSLFSDDIASSFNIMTIQEFDSWLGNFNCEWSKEVSVIIRSIIKDIRASAKFVINVDDDELDPIFTPNNRLIIQAYRDIANKHYQTVSNNACFVAKFSHLHEYNIAEQRRQELHVVVNGVHFDAINMINVLYAGWECDDKAWLVVDQGKKRIVMSAHGELYFAEKAELESKIREYESVLQDTKNMLNEVE